VCDKREKEEGKVKNAKEKKKSLKIRVQKRKKKLLLRQFADDTNQCAVLVAHFANI